MTTQEAREYLSYLLTLCIRKEQAFAPLAAKFVKEQDLDQLGLLPEEQFNLVIVPAYAPAILLIASRCLCRNERSRLKALDYREGDGFLGHRRCCVGIDTIRIPIATNCRIVGPHGLGGVPVLLFPLLRS